MKRKTLLISLGLAASILSAAPLYAADPASAPVAASESTPKAALKEPAKSADNAAFDKNMEAFLSKDENVEKIGSALERFFTKKREAQQQQAAQAEEKEMEDQFKNPVKIEIGKSPVKGPADAKITIVEFSDFQCPFCQRGAQVMDDVLKEYPKDVKVVFKHLPLPFHPQARPAAKAALAAQEQGKFWEMYDELFKSQANLSDETFVEIAKKVGLDVEKFKKDMANPEYDKALEADMNVATQLGVHGTPGFFVNGVQVRGARPLPYFKNIIDRWLKG